MSFQIAELDFDRAAVLAWRQIDTRHANWPVVYVLDDGRNPSPNSSTSSRLRDVYVGESMNAVARMLQHIGNKEKQHLKRIRVIFHEKFNKSVCLDLESYLIRMMAGDPVNRLLNQNKGIADREYYKRQAYQAGFVDIFERLKSDGIFSQSISDIENSELYKLSPFKALTTEQADSVEEIVERLLLDVSQGRQSTIVIQGDPGTGKSVVGIYLIKLLVDIQSFDPFDDQDNESRFSHFFTAENQRLLENFRIGLVVPLQALRKTIEAVFKKTQGLHKSMVLSTFDIGKSRQPWDLLLVDETHRLNQRASQASGVLNRDLPIITRELFGWDDKSKTQLDWMKRQSQHQVFLLDAEQSVRPADLPREILSGLVAEARASGRHFQLKTQIRVQAGSDFIAYIRWILDPNPTRPPSQLHFGDYDFRMFDSVKDMRDEIFKRDAEVGLSRLVAGYAWQWKSKDKKNRDAYDIEIDGLQLRWNTEPTDWVSSVNALEEVGSIHTVQGYDINYVGVLIGLDLRFDATLGRLRVDRKSYHDRKGKENVKAFGKVTSDDDLLRFVTQIYAVLLTRGIRGTYVYACDDGLRNYLQNFIPSSATIPRNSALDPRAFDPMSID